MDPAAEDEPRALVPEPAADAGRPHLHHGRPRRVRPRGQERGPRAVQPARAARRPRLRLAARARGRARRHRPAAGRRLLPAPVLDAERPRARRRSRTRTTAGGSTGRATRPTSPGPTSRTSRARACGAARCSCPAGPDGSHEVAAARRRPTSPRPTPAGVDALATASTIDFDESVGSWSPAALAERRALAPEHRPAPRQLDGHRGRRAGGTVAANIASTPSDAPATSGRAVGSRHAATGGSGRRSTSTAPITRPPLLLPDGRVVSAGDDFTRYGTPDFTQDSAEIYEPPYLFDGDAPAPRPAIARGARRDHLGAVVRRRRHACGRPGRRPRRPRRAERDNPCRRRQPACGAPAHDDHRARHAARRGAAEPRRGAAGLLHAVRGRRDGHAVRGPLGAAWRPAPRSRPAGSARAAARPAGHGHQARSCPRCGRGSCAAGTGAMCSCGSPGAAPRACASGCGSSTAATTSAAPRTSP